ncbi:hypothetical protein EC991_009633 [Linnemannia zychae]|nr:hypothetical protein EC991_009633 [Linnemannia zychae]
MQSISTESLPALFGAASLRRSNSNVARTSRTNTSTPVPSSNNTSYSTPSSPAHPLSSTKSPTGVNGTSGRASSPKQPSGVSSVAATVSTTTASPRRPPIDMISEQFELEGTHDRRPSSWDIMDMMAIDQLRQWMVCFCVVNFDLEKGQGKYTLELLTEFP